MFKKLGYLFVLSLVLLGGKNIYAAPDLNSSKKIVRGDMTINVPAPNETEIKGKTAASRSHPDFHESVWIYEYAISISEDHDYDGYNTSLDLWLDLDTTFFEQSIMIDLFLVDELGHIELIYTSDAFNLFSNSENDGINIHIDLGQGYPESQYHLLMDIYDASSFTHITTYDHTQISDFRHLPLESYEFDSTSRYVITETSYDVSAGGTTGFSLLILLTLILRIRIGFLNKGESLFINSSKQ